MTTKAPEKTPKLRVVLPVFDFDTEDAPVIHTQPKGPNRFAGIMATLAADWDDEKGRSAKSGAVTIDAAHVNAVRRQLADAAHDLGYSVKKLETPLDGGKVRVKFQPVKRVLRPRATDAK